MKNNADKLKARWLYLAVGTVAMLFAGIIYAWSILKSPLAEEFGWSASQLAVNYTLTMTFCCVGGVLGSQAAKRIGITLPVLVSGILAGSGFMLASRLTGENILLLYLTYAVIGGLGIGISYNLVISTVNAWFPDRRGMSSGCMLLGFGVSALLFGVVLDGMITNEMFGWRKTYLVFGISIGVVLAVTGLIIRMPDAEIEFPDATKSKVTHQENFEARDYTTPEMIRRFAFWRAFLCLTCLGAVGNSVISFARDLAISVGAPTAIATTLVGVLSVCNGLGRIITGLVFDAFGRRITMIGANLVAILASGLTLTAVWFSSLPLCVVGLCLTGLSYGANPTFCSAFVSAFYGQKYFSTNYSVVNFTLMTSAMVATVCSALLTSAGTYIAPFILLVVLAITSLMLNLSIRHP